MDTRSAFPTYISEIDQNILMDVDDANLFRACNIDSYTQSICDDEVFWRNRTLIRYFKLIKFRTPDTTWKAFYRRLVNDAMYIVGTAILKFFVYSNINDAYNMLWEHITAKYRLTREEILESISAGTFNIPSSIVYIKLAYKGEVSAVDDEYLLYDASKDVRDILEYPDLPALNVKGRELFNYAGSRFKRVLNPQLNREFTEYDMTPHNEFRGVFDYNDEVMHSFLKYYPPYAPDYPYVYFNSFYVLTMDSGRPGVKLLPFKYGYRTTGIATAGMNKEQITLTLYVDTSLFGKPLAFETFQFPVKSAKPSREGLARIGKIIEDYYNG